MVLRRKLSTVMVNKMKTLYTQPTPVVSGETDLLNFKNHSFWTKFALRKYFLYYLIISADITGMLPIGH